MSLNRVYSTDGHHDSPISDDTTAVSSASASKAVFTPSKHSDSITKSYLDVPKIQPSRTSLDSAFSDLSELSFHSNELQTHHPLIRSLSHSHNGPSSLPPRSRFLSGLHSFYIANYGAFLVLLSQFFGSMMNVSTRLLETPGPHGDPMHPFQILFARQSITAFLCTAYALTTKSIPDFPLGPRNVRWLLVARGLCGFFGVFGLYFSLLYLPLSEATVLTFLAPILTCYLCSFLIPGDSFSRQQQLAGFLSLVGVVFIAQPASLFSSTSTGKHEPASNTTATAIEVRLRFAVNGTTPTSSSSLSSQITPPTPSQHLTAIAIAMLGVLGGTGAMTSIRSIGTRAHPFLSINYFSVWCSVVSLFCLVVFPEVKFRLPANLLEWGLLGTLGFAGFVMQFLLTAGLAYGGPAAATTTLDGADVENTAGGEREMARRRENKSLKKGSGTRATSMVYTQMLFALAGDQFIFGITPGTMSWIGSGLILAGAVWVAAARDKEKTNKDTAAAAATTATTARTEDERPAVAATGGLWRTNKGNTHMDEETVGLMSEEGNVADDAMGEALELEDMTVRSQGQIDG